MDDRDQTQSPEKDPELRQPEEAVKDLEPETDETDKVKGGASAFSSL